VSEGRGVRGESRPEPDNHEEAGREAGRGRREWGKKKARGEPEGRGSQPKAGRRREWERDERGRGEGRGG